MYFEKWKQNLPEGKLRAQMDSMTPEEQEDAFYQYLDFGTAGLRGKMRPGTNSMNIYTVGKATQGIADYILSRGKQHQGVLVAFDSRHNSRLFARVSANVLAANGIKTYTFENIKGVPQTSFGIRHLGCFCGIMITASHNPCVYNGYKAFDHRGSQLSKQMAQDIMSYIQKVDEFQDVRGLSTQALHKDIVFIGEQVMDSYYQAVLDLARQRRLMATGEPVDIVYTPLCGAGSKPVTTILAQCGYRNVCVVKEQQEPDGNFPGMVQPNPEKEDCYFLAKEYAQHADIILATDPDCDRLGVMVKDGKGDFTLLTGNQIACIIFDFLLKTNRIPPDAFAVRSIVSTPLVDKMAQKQGVQMHKVLTGFRYIAIKIHQLHDSGQGTFFFGFEESNGYLTGDFVRDKDGCIAALLMSAAAGYYKNQGKSVYQALLDLYTDHGFVVDKSISFAFEGKQGQEKMEGIMKKMADVFDPFGSQTKIMENYQTLSAVDREGKQTQIDSDPANVLIWNLEDGTRMVLRPSGTEPKIKVYITCFAGSLGQAEQMFEQYEKQAIGMIENG